MNIVRVALDLPLPRLFDYLAPDSDESDIGRRVTVPFGTASRTGVIVAGAASEQPDAKLKEVMAILRDMPPCPPSGWRSANSARATTRRRSAK
jgi:primosomal protein N' (replication factor Y)